MVRNPGRDGEFASLALAAAGLAGGALLLVCLAAASWAQQPAEGTIPTSGITGQKPQSKLWYDQGTWWAVLPREGTPRRDSPRLGGPEPGAYLWRLVDGRFRAQETPGALKGTKGNCECDAALAGGTLYILAFQPRATESALHALRYENGSYRPLPHYPVALKHDAKVETIAFDVDSKGVLWAAWVNDSLEVVAVAFDPKDVKAGFSEPFVLGKGVGRDDIAAVAAFKGHVGVMWSNSKQQKFYFRAHRDGQPGDKWEAPEVPAEGKGMVNDHINLAADAEGNLWAVTKAATGRGRSAVQLTLYRRNPDGKWDKSYPVLPRDLAEGKGMARTRPVVVLDAERPLAYVMCSDKVKVSAIYLRRVSLTDGKVGPEIKALAADYALNNATDGKGMVSLKTGLLVLAGPARAKAGPARFRLFDLKELK